MTNKFTHIVVHYDEIGLKGDNRAFFSRALINNIQKLVHGDAVVRAGATKIVLEFEKDQSKIDFYLGKLQLIPGISSVSPAIKCKSTIEDISKVALEIAQFYQPKTFKIETIRADKAFAINSMGISREVGGFVLNTIGEDKIRVDVHNPDLTIKIELEAKQTLILGQKHEGIGGLPTGTAGKILCLLSGGLDSPVAAYLMMKRGATVDFIHFHNQTINTAGVEEKIKDLVRQLATFQGKGRLLMVPFAELQKEVITKIPSTIRMIVYRRLMYRIAERIARYRKARALVTGDSLSQVASQTIENLEVIYNATAMLKFNPLIGLNKREIIRISEQIGTFDISIRPYGDCCSLMIAKHPETRAKLFDILEAEKNLDVDDLILRAIKGIEKFEV